MRHLRSLLNSWGPAVAGLVLLLLVTSPSTFSDATPPLEIVGYQAEATIVDVTVFNPASETQRGTAYVDAIVGGETVRGFAPTVVMGQRTVILHIGFSSHVDSIVDVGIITDDGAPF